MLGVRVSREEDKFAETFWETHAWSIQSRELHMHLINSMHLAQTQVVLELWGEGSSSEEMLAAVTAYPTEMKAPYASTDQVCNELHGGMGNGACVW